MQSTLTVASLFALFVAQAGAQTAGNWTRQIPQNFPGPRYEHAMAYDAARGQVVVFGGTRDPSQPFVNETWVWDGSNWTQKFPQNSPSGRGGFAMAYDSAHSQIVLFGGGSNGPPDPFLLGDTWVWDGSNWTQKFPQNSPAARGAHAMAYDSAHGQVVLFGGDSNTEIRIGANDTWVWDGSNWAQKQPQISPPARVSPAMAYDSARAQVVLFGGVTNTSFSATNDTWVWDGSNWAQKSPQTSPPARTEMGMANDAAHNQVVLFGGFGNQNVYFNDTWSWHGANWVKQSPQTSPQSRFGHGLAFDSGRGKIFLFGGFLENNLQTAQDTWVFEGVSIGGLPSISNVISASGFGGFAGVAPGGWIEIYGSNFSSTTRQWGGADFTGNNAPTSLDGVQVSIGGQKAFVEYISPGQVNAQLPSTIGLGAAQLTLSNGPATSAGFPVTVTATQPGLLAPASFSVMGGGPFGGVQNQYVVAQLPDGTFVLPAGAIPGVASRPAKPGDTIVIYGTGFGPVNLNIPAGQIVTQVNNLVASVQILFGNTSARLSYFGLAPNLIGLYQFNVVVPAVPDNNLTPLTFTLSGAGGAQTLYTAVHQ
jgi:uncharacterized protein (TIGR03437 family)